MSFLAGAANAQEPRVLVSQTEWQAMGVCVGERQCGFCYASDTLAAGPSLRITTDSEVSVVMEGSSAKAATLEIGGRTFALTSGGSDSFVAKPASGREIVQAMPREKSLTVTFTGDRPKKRYTYNLAQFPRAYDAMIQSCPKAHPRG